MCSHSWIVMLRAEAHHAATETLSDQRQSATRYRISLNQPARSDGSAHTLLESYVTAHPECCQSSKQGSPALKAPFWQHASSTSLMLPPATNTAALRSSYHRSLRLLNICGRSMHAWRTSAALSKRPAATSVRTCCAKPARVHLRT